MLFIRVLTGERTPASTTTTTTTGPAATTSYKAPQLDPGKLLEPESYAPAALGEALGDSLGESVQVGRRDISIFSLSDRVFKNFPETFIDMFSRLFRILENMVIVG